MPRATSQIPSLSSETFTRRIVMPMAGMIVVAVGLVLAFVVVSANGQNRLEVSSSTKLAETALNVNQRQMGRNLRDYAVWEDVYKNLHVNVDFDWAATDGNVGANIYEGLGYERAFVVNPKGDTTYAVIDGVPRQANALDYLPEGLDGLIGAGRSQVKPAVSLLESGSDVLMVAVNSILPPSIDRATTDPDDLSMLIFVKKLDETFLTRMGAEYLLKDLQIERDPALLQPASVPLVDSAGKALAYLTWTPATPGYELLQPAPAAARHRNSRSWRLRLAGS